MSMLTERRVILASASPRRKMLLEQVGVCPTVNVADVPEYSTPPAGMDVAQMVMKNAEAKTRAVYAEVGTCDALIVGADTVVVKDGVVFGKPRDEAEAAAMLRTLSASRHSVFSGACVIDAATGAVCCDVSETAVYFCPLTEEEIAAYIAGGEPMDKAGSYGMQAEGAVFVERIDGDYSTVVGLSLPLLKKMIARVEGATA